MRVDLFDFSLPERQIARHPPTERDGGRLLHVAGTGELADRRVVELPSLLPPGALMVVNDTRVLPARLLGKKAATGGGVEVLLTERLDAVTSDPTGSERWLGLSRSSKPLRPSALLEFGGLGQLTAEVMGTRDTGLVELRLWSAAGLVLSEAIERAGHVPLPPYLRRADEPADRERYQTVFARAPGAVAAPTAGLHLSEALLARLAAAGLALGFVTLHVGLGTFRPVKASDFRDHAMHEEWLEVPAETAALIDAARGRGAPVIAVGTTVVRALESAAADDGRVHAFAGTTRLLIEPGFRFRVVDGLFTNFHLPRSTLLALVAAFGGRSRVLAAYAHAVRAGYRFYSYGDAMLLTSRVAADEAAA